MIILLVLESRSLCWPVYKLFLNTRVFTYPVTVIDNRNFGFLELLFCQRVTVLCTISLQREDHLTEMEAVSGHAHECEREDQSKQSHLARVVHAV